MSAQPSTDATVAGDLGNTGEILRRQHQTYDGLVPRSLAVSPGSQPVLTFERFGEGKFGRVPGSLRDGLH
jgi:hypothetical protein